MTSMAVPSLQPRKHILIIPEPLTVAAFAPFGTVISPPLSPSTTRHPILSGAPLPVPLYTESQPTITSANQGTALKASPFSPLLNHYPSKDEAKTHLNTSYGLMSIFSCFPRLNTYYSKATESTPDHRLKLGILERHPFTTQTFCPMSTSQPASGTALDYTYILIIVAPAISDSAAHPRNPPDLTRARAFITPAPLTGQPGTAVTYAPGTWHAPMIVLGSRRVDFLVTQFANGCADDDCQEVLIGDGPDEPILSRRSREERMGESASCLVEVDLSSLQLDDNQISTGRKSKL